MTPRQLAEELEIEAQLEREEAGIYPEDDFDTEAEYLESDSD